MRQIAETERREAHVMLLEAARACLASVFPEAHDFLPAGLPGADAFDDAPPMALPMLAELPEVLALASEATRPLVDCLLRAAPHLAWRQSYTEADGFSRAYLDHYGWINLVSPEGPFLSDSLRLTVGYWGRGLHYPRHAHAPEEIYCILAGEAVFHSDGHPPRRAGPGETILHLPNQPHAIVMEPGPLLALVPWKGEGLMRLSRFPGAA